MSKKYVIEIKPEYEDKFKGVMILGAENGNLYVDSSSVEELEELNSDYINEHFGDLQDTAYQRGLKDAWEAARKVALNSNDGGLGIEDLDEIFDCYTLQQVFKKHTAQQTIAKLKAYEQKQDDKIEVGDEVVSKHSGIKGILLEPETEDVLATIIVPSQRWRTIYDSHENLKKTGKHYNIEKILEAMKHD